MCCGTIATQQSHQESRKKSAFSLRGASIINNIDFTGPRKGTERDEDNLLRFLNYHFRITTSSKIARVIENLDKDIEDIDNVVWNKVAYTYGYRKVIFESESKTKDIVKVWKNTAKKFGNEVLFQGCQSSSSTLKSDGESIYLGEGF